MITNRIYNKLLILSLKNIQNILTIYSAKILIEKRHFNQTLIKKRHKLVNNPTSSWRIYAHKVCYQTTGQRNYTVIAPVCFNIYCSALFHVIKTIYTSRESRSIATEYNNVFGFRYHGGTKCYCSNKRESANHVQPFLICTQESSNRFTIIPLLYSVYLFYVKHWLELRGVSIKIYV